MLAVASRTNMSSIPRFPPHFGTEFAGPLHSQVPSNLEPDAHPLPSPFVALITGASRGIGAATAQAFAKAGATGLVLTARTAEALEQTKQLCLEVSTRKEGIKVSTLGAEAGSEEATRHMVEVVAKEHGRLDALINNVGLVSTDPSAWGQFDAIKPDQVLLPMQVNYFGRFLMIQSFLPLLLDTPNGARTVITISSECSHFTTFGPIGFNISEFASNRLTEVVAACFADEGLLAFSVHPGMVATTAPPGMSEEVFSYSGDSPGLCGAFCLWLIRERPDWLSGRYLSAKWDVEELVKKKAQILQEDKLKARMVV